MSRFSKRVQSQPGVLTVQLQSVENAYLSLQHTQRGLVGMLVACAVLGSTLLRVPAGSLGNRSFLPAIISASLLTFAYTTRNSMVLPSLAELRRNPSDPKLLKRWRRASTLRTRRWSRR